MADMRITRTRRALTTPRAAALAGILFAVLFATSLTLIRLSVPEHVGSGGAALEVNSRRIGMALNLLPYSGVAFLWFIGVIRDRLGELEDRFFSTIFLGSGLMFLALVFVSGGLAGATLSTLSEASSAMEASGLLLYSRMVLVQLLNIYAIRMAGVFMISLGTIWFRSGLMHRGWVLVTYVLALVLLVSISITAWVILIFPAWVFAVSIYYLVASLRRTNPADAVSA
jgi:hypothetical protein